MNPDRSTFWPKTLAVIGLLLLSYLILDGWVKTFFKQPFLSKEKLLARAETDNIESFFNLFGDSVAIFANLQSIKEGGEEASRDLDAFVEQWRSTNIVSGIILTNNDGTVKLNSNVKGTPDTGISVVDRDYFRWSKENQEDKRYFIGKPVVSKLGASKGSMVIPVAARILLDNSLQGILVASVRIDYLTERYFGKIKISDLTETFLIDPTGSVIFSDTYTDKIGSNISEIFVEPNFIEKNLYQKKLIQALEKEQYGSMPVFFIDPTTHKPGLRFLTYSKIKIGEQQWLLLIATPVSGLVSLGPQFYIRLATSITLLIIILSTFRGVIFRKVQKTLLK